MITDNSIWVNNRGAAVKIGMSDRRIIKRFVVQYADSRVVLFYFRDAVC